MNTEYPQIHGKYQQQILYIICYGNSNYKISKGMDIGLTNDKDLQ